MRARLGSDGILAGSTKGIHLYLFYGEKAGSAL
jgi:hypothetical protein